MWTNFIIISNLIIFIFLIALVFTIKHWMVNYLNQPKDLATKIRLMVMKGNGNGKVEGRGR